MANWAYSASLNVFYYIPLKESYEQAGSWPADAIDVSDEDYTTYMGTPPAGKVRGPVNGLPAWVDIIYNPDEEYARVISTLQSNGSVAAAALRVPFAFEQIESWLTQVKEAEAWTSDNNYVPVTLNAMVSASNGSWTLPDLAGNIISNAAIWRSASGNILGQLKTKFVTLEAIKAGIPGGTHDVHELVNFDCTITAPAVTYTNKYQ